MIDFDLFKMGADKMCDVLSILFGGLSVILPFFWGFVLFLISLGFFINFIRRIK